MKLTSSMQLMCNSGRAEAYGGGWTAASLSDYVVYLCGSHSGNTKCWYRDAVDHRSEDSAGRGVCSHWRSK